MIKDVNFDVIGNLIHELRERYNLTQQQFADEIKVSKGAVCQWESGSGIKTEKLYDIAKFFNITVEELLEGKLNEEEEDNYFGRNYNLDDFDYFEEVTSENYANLLEYLKRCKNVIKRFMHLFELDQTNQITKKQSTEYAKLFRYFEKDWDYAQSIFMDSFVSTINDAVEELKETWGMNESSELDRMLYKLFYLKIKINPKSLLNYEEDDLAANEYLEIIGKERESNILTRLVYELKDEEKEHSLALKRLIEHGAVCLYTTEKIRSFEYNEISNETFESLEGNIKENVAIEERLDYLNKEMKTSHISNYYDPLSWKNFSESEFDFLEDKDLTSEIRDIIMLKDSDPKTYYKNLVKRDENKIITNNPQVN